MERLERSEIEIEEFYKKKEETLESLRNYENSEILNSYGIILESSLYITLIEAKNFNYSDSNIFLLLKCGENSIKTDSIPPNNLSWNLEYSLY